MAHFAEIDSNNIVVRVLVVPDEQEHRGQDYLAVDCNLGGTWIQTSYNNNIKGIFAGEGYTYDAANDIFIEPRPLKGWVWNGSEWVAPTPYPGDNYKWDEATESWIEKPTVTV